MLDSKEWFEGGAADPFADNTDLYCKPAFHRIPMAGSTDEPEGLLSWAITLARSHHLGPRTLFKHLMMQSPVHRDIWNGSTFFDRDCATVNGLGKYCEMMLDLTESALPIEAGCMCLLSLRRVLSHNGEGLLAKSPRWCDMCLCDQLRRGQRPHFSLVWSMEYYRVCHRHHVHMSEHCPSCGATQAFVPSYPSLVHCGACGESLLAGAFVARMPVAPSIHDFDAWCSCALADLVARSDQIASAGSLVHLRGNLEDIVHRYCAGNRKRFCEETGLQIYALNGWINKGERPSLAVLLRLCYGIGLMPADIFLENAIDRVARPTLISAEPGQRDDRPLLGMAQRQRIGHQLEVIVDDPTDCRGLAAVASEVGLSRHALKYWYRAQCEEIVRKNRASENRRIETRYREDHAFLKAAFRRLRAEGVYPGRRRISAELAQRKVSLMRPDLFRAYERLRSTLVETG